MYGGTGIRDVISDYSEEALDNLASDKVDEVANLRLPKTVLMHEIVSALSSRSYIAKALAHSRPPAYAFLKLLLDAPNYELPIEGFREAVVALTNELTERSASGEGFAIGKNYSLYLKIVRVAWENDGVIDRSEELILEELRTELGIPTREHLLLEHHPDVRPFWENDGSFNQAKKHLLSTGLVLSRQDSYLIAREVVTQIRESWGIELDDASYFRLLDLLTGQQLRDILEKASLPLSGSKEERIERILLGLISPKDAIDTLHIDNVRSLCKKNGLKVTAAKADLISSLIEHFASGRDLEAPEEDIEESPLEIEPEERVLTEIQFTALCQQLTIDQLYDILKAHSMRLSGSKSDKIQRIISSPFSESTLLKNIRNSDLAMLCRRLGIRVSGIKEELIDRLVTSFSRRMDTQELGGSGQQGVTPMSWDEMREDEPPPSPPSGLHGVQADYPELELDESIVLALLKEAKSLTEQEIERACRRHRIGWFLIKAHMVDLMARLRRSGTCPIRIRCAGGLNIYEWTFPGSSTSPGMSQENARDVIDALRQGIVPDRGLDLLMVGQKPARIHLNDLLQHVCNGKSEFKFIRGAYGSGKTFLCSWLKEKAFEADFAVSTVRIGPDMPLSDLTIFFSGLVNGLRSPEKRDATALPDILESWLLSIHRKVAQLEGLSAFDPRHRRQLAMAVERQISSELARLSDFSPGLAPAVKAFYSARLKGDQESATTAISWLQGSRSLSGQSLRAIGVKGQLEDEEVVPRIRALLEVISGSHLKGLLLLVDEVELVRRFAHARQREQAYEIIRLLIDEAGENDLPNCLLIFTGTDALFEDSKYGMASYEALANRIETIKTHDGRTSVKQPVVMLEPLDPERLLAVARRVRDIHSEAYSWSARERVNRASLERLVSFWTAFGDQNIGRLPRPVLRELVLLLDLCEENPDITPEECIRSQAESDLQPSFTGQSR